MINLYEKGTGKLIGKITENDLKFLIDYLVEETKTDTDYFITKETLKYLKEKGASTELFQLLEDALGDRQELEIEYKKEIK